MSKNVCQNCDREERKRRGYLCDKMDAEDGLPVRCIHSQSELKLKLLKYYLDIVSEAMKIRFKEKRYFLDLFSGPGLCWNRDDGLFVKGSSLLALDLKTRFTDYIFVDSNEQTCVALRTRIAKLYTNLESKIEFLNLNTNKDVLNIMTHIQKDKALIVAFLDPNAFDIQFNVIKALSNFKSIDLIINFAIHDLLRNAQIYKDGTSGKANLVFGCEDWPNKKLEWLSFYKNKLVKLGFRAVEEDFEQKAKVKTLSNRDIYYLIYASKHPRGLEFWREAKKKYLQGDIFGL
ncbi:MAG: three-Cys-motif partner protein TcmP [Candidatus Zixiibacteriota bacterium]